LLHSYQGYPSHRLLRSYQGYPSRRLLRSYQGYPSRRLLHSYQGYPSHRLLPSCQGYPSRQFGQLRPLHLWSQLNQWARLRHAQESAMASALPARPTKAQSKQA
jgi:hypothetical protein